MALTVGTAGHIDHGKTWLVRALTGKDTDRLPEERERGISIALGYAPLELPDGTQLSLVDVPGHERFVRTMVAGANSAAGQGREAGNGARTAPASIARRAATLTGPLPGTPSPGSGPIDPAPRASASSYPAAAPSAATTPHPLQRSMP